MTQYFIEVRGGSKKIDELNHLVASIENDGSIDVFADEFLIIKMCRELHCLPSELQKEDALLIDVLVQY